MNRTDVVVVCLDSWTGRSHPRVVALLASVLCRQMRFTFFRRQIYTPADDESGVGSVAYLGAPPYGDSKVYLPRGAKTCVVRKSVLLLGPPRQAYALIGELVTPTLFSGKPPSSPISGT